MSSYTTPFATPLILNRFSSLVIALINLPGSSISSNCQAVTHDYIKYLTIGFLQDKQHFDCYS